MDYQSTNQSWCAVKQFIVIFLLNSNLHTVATLATYPTFCYDRSARHYVFVCPVTFVFNLHLIISLCIYIVCLCFIIIIYFPMNIIVVIIVCLIGTCCHLNIALIHYIYYWYCCCGMAFAVTYMDIYS